MIVFQKVTVISKSENDYISFIKKCFYENLYLYSIQKQEKL